MGLPTHAIGSGPVFTGQETRATRTPAAGTAGSRWPSRLPAESVWPSFRLKAELPTRDPYSPVGDHSRPIGPTKVQSPSRGGTRCGRDEGKAGFFGVGPDGEANSPSPHTPALRATPLQRGSWARAASGAPMEGGCPRPPNPSAGMDGPGRWGHRPSKSPAAVSRPKIPNRKLLRPVEEADLRQLFLHLRLLRRRAVRRGQAARTTVRADQRHRSLEPGATAVADDDPHHLGG